ncbi:MAG: molecular chaperone DnaK [Deltaproteobacteria bacterium]|nr:molecular chaperone DnaK [Deltaproteobacteria bacterium]
MSKVIGIDLGTTYSCVAITEQGQTRVLPSRTGPNTTPSVVAITENGKRLVGHLAKRQAITNPKNTIHGAKRLIGRRFNSPDVERAMKLVAYGCIEGPHGDVRVNLGDTIYSIPEIASMILQEMRLLAEKAIGEPISKAVITVPAYFNDNQRQATKDAGRIAGMDVLRIINEPTAAALAYGFDRGLEQKVAVFDLGGGTFDISILEISNGIFEVLTTIGDTFLGGEDFDERIIEWLRKGFFDEHNIDLSNDKMALQRLRDAAERAKCELSSSTSVDINLPFIYTCDSGQALHLQTKLTQETLIELVIDLIKRTISICERALASSELQKSDIGSVILVGGMTRMPRVQEEVEKFFAKPPSKGVHPDEVVACGAAIQGHLLASGDNKTLLLDVTPHNLGIMVQGGLFDVIIKKDTTIPTSEKKTFTTIRDDQTQVRIVVLQGELARGEQNELLGEFLLDGLPKRRKGEVKIEVTFDISADGIVSVSACDLETSKTQAITVTATSGLTEEEIAIMAAENENVLLASEASDAFENERVEIERLIREIERLLPEAQPIATGTDFGGAALQKAEQTLKKARFAIKKREISEMQSIREPLERTITLLRSVIGKLKN